MMTMTMRKSLPTTMLQEPSLEQHLKVKSSQAIKYQGLKLDRTCPIRNIRQVRLNQERMSPLSPISNLQGKMLNR